MSTQPPTAFISSSQLVPNEEVPTVSAAIPKTALALDGTTSLTLKNYNVNPHSDGINTQIIANYSN